MIFSGVKIISGGQTGADRAALDFALQHDIPCGGWCPKGRLAEDGFLPERYPLLETSTGAYSQRTRKNIEDSDGTVIIIRGNSLDRGTRLTRKICREQHKPFLIIDLEEKEESLKTRLAFWMKEENIRILNIAGPRESFLPGIYSKTLDFLGKFLPSEPGNR
ncbi:MAG: putative molybdenum carrier protein [Bacteroidales bacterium]|nr:MAG: putative molybdenum carrier protein [Bacteroidales bacterium]